MQSALNFLSLNLLFQKQKREEIKEEEYDDDDLKTIINYFPNSPISLLLNIHLCNLSFATRIINDSISQNSEQM